jgi:hypothetical protein
MFIQEFVRGMRDLSPTEVRTILDEGMVCQALRQPAGRSTRDLEAELTDDNLNRHRHEHTTYGPHSPYISTTAGTIREMVQLHPDGSAAAFTESWFAFDTALEFAVLTRRSDGWLFYGYHFLLGRPAGRHAEFAEEIRDLHQHPQWSKYRGEGEIAAAIRIPPRRIKRAELFRYADVYAATRGSARLAPSDVIENSSYLPPEALLAPRGVI